MYSISVPQRYSSTRIQGHNVGIQVLFFGISTLPFPSAHYVGVVFCILCANFWGQICVKASGLSMFLFWCERHWNTFVTGLWRCALFRLQCDLVHIPAVKSLGGFSLTFDFGLSGFTHATLCFVGVPSARTFDTSLAGLLIFSVAVSVLSFPFIVLTWAVVVASFFPQFPNLLFQILLFLLSDIIFVTGF